MNYIGLVRAFWRSQEEHSFGPTEVALYFYLLEVCNICRWKNPFKRSNAKIEADLSMTFHVLKNARNRLKSAGLIDFKTTSGSQNVTYTLLPTLQINYEVSNEVGDEVVYEVRNEVVPGKDKLNKTKLITPLLSPQGDSLAPVPESSAADDSLPDCVAAPQAPPGCAAPPRGDEAKLVAEVVEFYNTRCVGLPEVKAVTPKRSQAVLARIREHGKQAVFDMLEAAAESAFLSGQNSRGWLADFGWLFRPENFVKVYEGKYANKEPANSVCGAVPDGLTANERRYGSTKAAKQSIENRLKQLSAKVKADIP